MWLINPSFQDCFFALRQSHYHSSAIEETPKTIRWVPKKAEHNKEKSSYGNFYIGKTNFITPHPIPPSNWNSGVWLWYDQYI